jgi:hypothetical protein
VVSLNLRDRVTLLAASYLDVCDGSEGETVTTRVLGFKEPQRGFLWREGSYWEFECSMNELRDHARLKHRWFWLVYVDRKEKLSTVATHKRHAAEQGLSFVVSRTKQRGHGNIYVPEEVAVNSHNYGFAKDFSETEARSARRPRMRLAA